MVWEQEELEHEDGAFRETPLDFDFLSLLSKPKSLRVISRVVPVDEAKRHMENKLLRRCLLQSIMSVSYDFRSKVVDRWMHGIVDYYKILGLDYDASEETIRSNYIHLALKWHPDKRKDGDDTTSRFQEINEAYEVLSDPDKRREYDRKGLLYIPHYREYLNQIKGLILTCNGLGIRYSIF